MPCQRAKSLWAIKTAFQLSRFLALTPLPYLAGFCHPYTVRNVFVYDWINYLFTLAPSWSLELLGLVRLKLTFCRYPLDLITSQWWWWWPHPHFRPVYPPLASFAFGYFRHSRHVPINNVLCRCLCLVCRSPSGGGLLCKCQRAYSIWIGIGIAIYMSPFVVIAYSIFRTRTEKFKESYPRKKWNKTKREN